MFRVSEVSQYRARTDDDYFFINNLVNLLGSAISGIYLRKSYIQKIGYTTQLILSLLVDILLPHVACFEQHIYAWNTRYSLSMVSNLAYPGEH
jgi:hypothetical protein